MTYATTTTIGRLELVPGTWAPDNRAWGFYFQTGYRLPWYGIMPWFGLEYDHLGKSSPVYEEPPPSAA